MLDTGRELAWNLITELRKETLESQRMRTQVIGFKITFVSAAIGFIYANEGKIPPESFGVVLTIPAFAAIFFDLLIVSYSVAIRRIGLYCKNHLERQLKADIEMHKGFCFWEDFFEEKRMRPSLAIFANLGITLLALAPAIADMVRRSYHSWVLYVMAGLFIYDVAAFFVPGIITEESDNIFTWLFLGGQKSQKFVVCVDNGGNPNLVVGKLYRVLPDEGKTKVPAQGKLVRVIDDSGEASPYLAEYFAKVKLPRSVEKDLLAKS
jgi:hypothetical protein